MKNYYVYILKCNDETYYTGITSDLEKRIYQHQTGFFPNSYTSSRLPIKLEYVAEFQDVNDAIAREKQVKNWSQAKKQALIVGNFEELQQLSKKFNLRVTKN